MLSFDKRKGVQLLVRIYNHFSWGFYKQKNKDALMHPYFFASFMVSFIYDISRNED